MLIRRKNIMKTEAKALISKGKFNVKFFVDK